MRDKSNGWNQMVGYESKVNPEMGEDVQYVAIHVIRFNKIVRALGLKDDGGIVSFFLREIEKGE